MEHGLQIAVMAGNDMAPREPRPARHRVLSYFGVAELKDIAASDFLRVIRSLEKRRKAA